LRAEHADVSAPPMHRVLSKPTGTGIDSARLEGGIEPWRSETKAKPLIEKDLNFPSFSEWTLASNANLSDLQTAA
jgi:hypothetical protein